MGIQLTNPNIIDLTEWQKVVNEITYLSARIDAITTAQGALKSSSIDWSATNSFSQQFNLGSHKILFGRDQAVVGDTITETSGFYEGSINFAETAGVGTFSAKPIVNANIVFGGTTINTSSNKDVIITLFNVSTNGFNYRLRNSASSTTLSGKFYIHWTAIGPQ